MIKLNLINCQKNPCWSQCNTFSIVLANCHVHPEFQWSHKSDFIGIMGVHDILEIELKKCYTFLQECVGIFLKIYFYSLFIIYYYNNK